MERYLDKVIQIERFKTCFEGHYEGNYNFTGEFHPFWEIVYVLDGTVNVSGDERVYTLHKGDMIFHKPMEFHRIWSHSGNEIHVLIMSFRASGTLMSQLENLVLSLDCERIAQMVIMPVSTMPVVEVDELDETSRGAGGFGSTGRA